MARRKGGTCCRDLGELLGRVGTREEWLLAGAFSSCSHGVLATRLLDSFVEGRRVAVIRVRDTAAFHRHHVGEFYNLLISCLLHNSKTHERMKENSCKLKYIPHKNY